MDWEFFRRHLCECLQGVAVLKYAPYALKPHYHRLSTLHQAHSQARAKVSNICSPWVYSSFLLNHSGSSHLSSNGALILSRIDLSLSFFFSVDFSDFGTTGDDRARCNTQHSWNSHTLIMPFQMTSLSIALSCNLNTLETKTGNPL